MTMTRGQIFLLLLIANRTPSKAAPKDHYPDKKITKNYKSARNYFQRVFPADTS